MIARVADNCFWLGRYIERTENTARVLQVTGALALDAELPARRCWHPLVVVSGQEADYVERFGRDALGDAELVQRYLTRDEKNPVSLVRSIGAAREPHLEPCDPLSPHGEPPDRAGGLLRSEAPVIRIGLAFAAISLALFLLLRVTLSFQLSHVTDRMHAYSGGTEKR